MNQLESIKMKVQFEQKIIEGQKQSGVIDDYHKFRIDYVGDVLLLLSRLEIAEKVLEWYSNIPHYDRRLSGGTSAVEADAGGRAREAIQQLVE